MGVGAKISYFWEIYTPDGHANQTSDFIEYYRLQYVLQKYFKILLLHNTRKYF